MRVSVFGGAHLAEGSPAYLEAVELGQRLAQLGHTVLTGGYSGTMEAVSRGAAEAGGKVIGVTCADIERAYRRITNRWVQEEWKKETLLERLEALLLNCEAAMAMPGGTGTLTEIALAWNLMIVGGMPQRPLILIGKSWSLVFHEFFERLDAYIPARQRQMLSFAANPLEAIAQLGVDGPPHELTEPRGLPANDDTDNRT